LDEDKIFMVGRGETDLRLDVPFYRPSLVKYLQRIDNHPAGVEPIRNLAIKVVDGPFGTQLKAEEYVEIGIPLIRVSDVRTGKIAKEGLVFITPEKQADLSRSKVLPNDVVLTKAGAILGYAAVFPEELVEGNITSHSVLIRCYSKVLPQYLAYFLRSAPGQRQVYRWGNKATRPELNTQEVKRIHVPILSIDQQRTVISVMAEGEQRRDSLNVEARKLLESIDNYLLAELGITLPPEPVNTIANRIFTAQRRELSGWRFDPYYFGDKFHALEHALEYGLYPATSLGQLCLSINNGIDCRDFIDGGVPYAKVADVKPFAVDLGLAQTVPHAAVPDRGFVKKGDLLLTRKGTFGVAALVETDTTFAISSEVFRMGLDGGKVLGPFLVSVLNSSICQEQFDRQKIGAIMGSLTQVSLRRIRVPLPPLAKQKEIQRVVEGIRHQASSLRKQAETELENAKRRIEAMLLGELVA
jgi:hypothetical protein